MAVKRRLDEIRRCADKQLHFVVYMPRLSDVITVTRRGGGDMFIGSGEPVVKTLARERRESGMSESRRHASLFAVARSNAKETNLQ